MLAAPSSTCRKTTRTVSGQQPCAENKAELAVSKDQAPAAFLSATECVMLDHRAIADRPP